MKKTLCGEGDGNDDCANSGHYPGGSELQTFSLFSSSATHAAISLSLLSMSSLSLSVFSLLDSYW